MLHGAAKKKDKFCILLGDKGNVDCFQKLLSDHENQDRAGSQPGGGRSSEGLPGAAGNESPFEYSCLPGGTLSFPT